MDACVALWIMGEPFGFMAFLGVASLIGGIVSHSIVLFDFIEERNAEGENFEVGWAMPEPCASGRSRLRGAQLFWRCCRWHCMEAPCGSRSAMHRSADCWWQRW